MSHYPDHKPQADSDWLNPHPVVTMLAFGFIENLVESETYVTNSRGITSEFNWSTLNRCSRQVVAATLVSGVVG